MTENRSKTVHEHSGGGFWKATKLYCRNKGGVITRGHADPLLCFVLGILIAAGLIGVYLATLTSYGDSEFYKQLLYVAVSVVGMLLVSVVNYRVYEFPLAVVGTLLSVVLLLLTAAFGNDHNGTTRSLDFGAFQLQASEFAKAALILTLACIFDRYYDQITDCEPITTGFLARIAAKVNNKLKCPFFNTSLWPIVGAGILVAAYAVLVNLGSHLSGFVIMGLIGFLMFSISGVRKKWIVVCLLAGTLVIVGVFGYGHVKGYLGTSSDTTAAETDDASSSTDSESAGGGLIKAYQYERLRIWLDKDDTSYTGSRAQTNTALAAITTGGFFGKGFGNSTLNSHLTECKNDFIFSIWVETFGFCGGIFLLLLFAVLIWRIAIIGVNCPDRYGSLLAFGIAFEFAIQVILHVAVNIDLFPNTGISLPFFSSGGSSMLAYCLEIGVVLNLSKNMKYRKRILKSGDTK